MNAEIKTGHRQGTEILETLKSCQIYNTNGESLSYTGLVMRLLPIPAAEGWWRGGLRERGGG